MASSLIPGPDGSPDHVQKWRNAVGISLVVLAAVFTAHLALACGWFPAVYGGFAKADDLSTLKDTVNEIRVYQVEAGLFTVRREQCAAVAGDNLQARAFYSEKLTGLQRQYWSLVGHDYPLPACGEL